MNTKTLLDFVRYPVYPGLLEHAEIVSSGCYAMRFARNMDDLDAVFKLRYEVFNLELDEGLERSHELGRDFDEYDESCHHLMVIDTRTDVLVGTYRMQTREMALEHKGFYSHDEFFLEDMPAEVLNSAVELGRACVHVDHRSRRVLFLLWRGLLRYLTANNKRYFFGCSSLTSQEANEAVQAHRYLERNGHMHPDWLVRPKPGFACESLGVVPEDPTFKLPKLMGSYLKNGTRVCSLPAIDRQFKTIDFLVIFDVKEADEHFRKLIMS